MHVTRVHLLSIGHLASDPQWKLPSHGHPFCELIVPIRGRMRVESPGTKLNATIGDVLLYPPRVIHAEWSDAAAPVAVYFFSFQAASVPKRDLIKTQDHAGRILHMSRWLYEERHASDPYVQEERQFLFQAIVAEYFRNLNHREAPMVIQTRKYIHDHMAESLTLSGLARQAGMSKYHFLRSYNALTGRTPMEDVRIIRANAARALILSTALPLKDIAPQTGLGNEYAMSRIFRHYFNMPPGAWRRHWHGSWG
ncbi:MAG: AraC family transcriptional regulator [Kiritimatiellaeota bacterium]|nr:AraC family transcriptional regulator [Kiritimatiellota bacterium]